MRLGVWPFLRGHRAHLAAFGTEEVNTAAIEDGDVVKANQMITLMLITHTGGWSNSKIAALVACSTSQF